MTPEQTISAGIVAAIAAAFACVVSHRWAKRRHWPYIPRYVTGGAIWLLAFAFPLFGALDINNAIVLFGVAVLIFAAEGLATWIAHDMDAEPQTSAPASMTPEADKLLREIDEELRK